MSTIVDQFKIYKSNEVRHFYLRPEVESSASGQYSEQNFPELVNRIQSIKGQALIYFVDTLKLTHFELNQKAVHLKADDNSQKTSEEIEARENELVEKLKNTSVLFRKTDKTKTDEKGEKKNKKAKIKIQVAETVENSSTVRQFVEANKQCRYIRFAVDEHGPLTDDQVEMYMNLLIEIEKQGAWLHTNSHVGGAAAILLISMRAILKNASPATTIEKILEDDKTKKMLEKPKEDDVNGQKKIDRAAFLREFFDYAKNRQEHQQKWTEWRKTQGKAK